MADLRDEFGNPVQLTDEIGNPVQLTDEHGNPVHITGVATSVGGGTGGTLKEMLKKDEPVDLITKDETVAGVAVTDRRPVEKIDSAERRREAGRLDRSSSTSSSSSSSEDDGMGGRRKKGLKDKLKEKLNLGKDKDQEPATVTGAPASTVTPFPAGITGAPASTVTPFSAATAAPAAKVTTHPPEPLHEKKSMLEKIKEKLPGHHGHGTGH